ncbi:MAG: hypothetical protein IJR14_09775 [Synergistaceae bacterium]|nr:hypothetical protein [Synergistaceae bacterium]
MAKKGRPRKEIDKALFEKLCGLQCTLGEMAAFFGCCEDTIQRWAEQEYGKEFSAVFEQKRGAGKISLRRMQWRLAEKSPAMAIFLGKNLLGQSDRQGLELTGPDGGPVRVSHGPDLTRLSKEELMTLDAILEKAEGVSAPEGTA